MKGKQIEFKGLHYKVALYYKPRTSCISSVINVLKCIYISIAELFIFVDLQYTLHIPWPTSAMASHILRQAEKDKQKTLSWGATS